VNCENITIDDLCHRNRERRDEAYECFYCEHNPALVGYSNKIVYLYEDAEDICQDVWYIVQKKVCKENVTNFRSWIFTIARNLTFNCIRNEKDFVRVKDGIESLYGRMEQENIYDTELFKKTFYDLSSSFNPRHRDMIISSEIMGEPKQDIARRHGIVPGAVSNVIRRFKLRLKIILLNMDLTSTKN
jgi:RNA polymerase sigma factor (sigma-70 family)